MYWRQQVAVGAVSGQSRGWARPVVETGAFGAFGAFGALFFCPHEP